jgi:hypothetical protein
MLLLLEDSEIVCNGDETGVTEPYIEGDEPTTPVKHRVVREPLLLNKPLRKHLRNRGSL